MQSKTRKFQFAPQRRRVIEIPSANMRDSMGVLFDTTPLNAGHGTGIHRIRNWVSDNCIFTQMDTDAFAVRKTRAQSVNGEHLVFVHRYVRGHLRGRLGDFSVDRDPGSIYILNQESRVECVQTPSTMQAILLPKAAIGYHPDEHAPLEQVSGTHPLGRTMNALFDTMFDGLLSRNDVPFDTMDRLIACLSMALRGQKNDQDVRRYARDAVAAQICSHVEQKLDHWDLSVNTLLRDFGVSRASLYRMFEHRGGVRQYISERRLLRAVLEITKQPLRRGQISVAAERWGFSSSASFSRSVRRTFGVAPGSLVNAYDSREGVAPTNGARFDFRDTIGQSIGRLAQSKLLMPR